MDENRIIEPTIFTSNKLFIQQLLSYKYAYVLLTMFFLSIAYFYNNNSPNQYEVYATIMANKSETSAVLGANELFRGVQSFQAYNDIEDGINNIRSFSLISSTIDELNLEVGYFSEEVSFFKNKIELFNKAPFSVNIDKSHIQPLDVKFYVEILSDSTFRIFANESEAILFNYIDKKSLEEKVPIIVDEVYQFNQTINSNFFNITITKNNGFKPPESEIEYSYFFKFNNPDAMAKEYLRNLFISRVSPSSSLLNVSYRGENLDKAIFFLNNYLNIYFEKSLARKNTIAINTINFIDSQISEISDSLVRSESKLESFRSVNQVMNLSYQGQALFDNLQRIDVERTELENQERYYTYVLDYFRNNQDLSGIIPPSAMNVNNDLMNQVIEELLNLNSERSNIIKNRGERNLFLGEVENKINVQKQTIVEIASNNLNTLKLTLNELNYRADKLSKEISTLPRRELNMVNIQRKFDLNDAIYTYLLQKRSEATITMASNYADFSMLEPARYITSLRVAPRSFFNFLVAIAMGVIIPTAFMILKNLINFRVRTTEYVHQLIDRPALAVIYSSTKKSEKVLLDNPLSFASESFRTLRGSVFQKLSHLKTNVILISSPQPQDGKSFVSFNLAISIALVGKKTIIVDGDLKRPTLHEKFSLENEIGITNFMVSDVSIDEMILETGIENLSFIPAGPRIPNSAEKIDSGILDPLIKILKQRFEYIIIDTTPFGLLADAHLLTRYADYVLLVVRNNVTRKDAFNQVIEGLNTRGITNYDVIYNDKDMKQGPHGLYTNYYIKERKFFN